jgi:hypothetical protein
MNPHILLHGVEQKQANGNQYQVDSKKLPYLFIKQVFAYDIEIVCIKYHHHKKDGEYEIKISQWLPFASCVNENKRESDDNQPNDCMDENL